MGWFSRKKGASVPDNMDETELLNEAKTAEDPAYAWACLQRAEILRPDSLPVQRALLMHGRLHEQSRQPGDYSIIKSYLLHSFEHPERYSEEGLRQAAQELFGSPRLLRCLELADKAPAFLEGYIDQLAEEYVRVFIAGDSSHAPRVFGFSAKGSLHSYLAKPTADTISNALQSPFLSKDQQLLVAKSVYRQFSLQMGGETRALDRLLGAEICGVLA